MVIKTNFRGLSCFSSSCHTSWCASLATWTISYDKYTRNLDQLGLQAVIGPRLNYIIDFDLRTGYIAFQLSEHYTHPGNRYLSLRRYRFLVPQQVVHRGKSSPRNKFFPFCRGMSSERQHKKTWSTYGASCVRCRRIQHLQDHMSFILSRWIAWMTLNKSNHVLCECGQRRQNRQLWSFRVQLAFGSLVTRARSYSYLYISRCSPRLSRDGYWIAIRVPSAIKIIS